MPRMSTWRAVHRGDRAAVGDDDRIVVEQLVELVGDDLRLHRRVGARAALVHQLAPVAACPSARASRNLPLSFFLQQRQQLGQDALAVADQADVDRIAKADPLGIELDLDRLGLCPASGRIRCRGRSSRRSAGCRSSPSLPATAWCRAGRRRRWCRGCRRAPLPCRAAACRSAPAAARRPRAAPAVAPIDPRPARMNGFSASLRMSAARCSISGIGQLAAARHDVRHVVRDVALGPVLRRLRLEVDRDHDVRRLAVGEGGAAGLLDDVLDMRRAHHAHRIGGRVHEQLVERDVLLGVGLDQVVVLRAGDRQHRLVVELGVVDAVEQVDAAGPRGREADAELAGELRIGAGREGRGFLVPDLDEPDLVLALREALRRRR